jgi:hypothetical protein
MAQHRSILCSLWACAALAGGSVGAATPLHPTHGEEVIEVLQSVTRVRLSAPPTASAKPDLASALQVARAAVQDARQSGEARYWGRAQAALSPWWDAADAPSAAAVLQATVQQGRHEFTAARQVLINTVAREPGNAQAWLNLAALERLSGQYPQALHACAAVARAAKPSTPRLVRWKRSLCRAVTRTRPPACDTCSHSPATASKALGCCPWPQRTKNARGTMVPPTAPTSPV